MIWTTHAGEYREGQHPMVTLLHGSQHRKNPQLRVQVCIHLRESQGRKGP